MGFTKWLMTFLEEKGIDADETLTAEGPSGTNWIPVGVLVEFMVQAPKAERDAIKRMLVKIDFVNGNVRDYLAHLCKAVAQ